MVLFISLIVIAWTMYIYVDHILNLNLLTSWLLLEYVTILLPIFFFFAFTKVPILQTSKIVWEI